MNSTKQIRIYLAVAAMIVPLYISQSQEVDPSKIWLVKGKGEPDPFFTYAAGLKRAWVLAESIHQKTEETVNESDVDQLRIKYYSFATRRVAFLEYAEKNPSKISVTVQRHVDLIRKSSEGGPADLKLISILKPSEIYYYLQKPYSDFLSTPSGITFSD